MFLQFIYALTLEWIFTFKNTVIKLSECEHTTISLHDSSLKDSDLFITWFLFHGMYVV